MRHATGTTKTAAQRQLREMLRDHEDGLAMGPQTVADAVQDWLQYGLGHRDQATAKKAVPWQRVTSCQVWEHASFVSCPPTT